MSKQEDKKDRRDFLFTASYTVGAVGIGATIWPLIHQMNPDESVKAMATTEVDISQVEPGKKTKKELKKEKLNGWLCLEFART
jgi:Rieske Fe-S protein